MAKPAILRELFKSDRIILAMGAHNGLSAKLAEKNGFDVVWASSFEISTSYGLPDASILTMTEYLAATQTMNEVVRIPVVADCDSGFGNEANVAHMVTKYEAAGVAAVCVEDKPFPKTNSFINGHQKMVSVDDFTAKIKAGCQARKNKDFLFIARTEALIVGLGIEEALRRASAYADSGADAILIHSKSPGPDEVFDFARQWEQRTPVVAVPTTYYKITAAEAERAGIKMIIYANHGIRSAVHAMNETMAKIFSAGTSNDIESSISSMGELFELQGMAKVRRIAR